MDEESEVKERRKRNEMRILEEDVPFRTIDPEAAGVGMSILHNLAGVEERGVTGTRLPGP